MIMVKTSKIQNNCSNGRLRSFAGKPVETIIRTSNKKIETWEYNNAITTLSENNER